MQPESIIDAAAWAGRQQAFAFVASHAIAARAQCLRQIRESRAYEQLGISWEEFCVHHAGISRVYADRLIQRLDEFGETYFKLSQLTRISPHTYRQIAGHLQDDALEIDGETIPLLPENLPRIRTSIRVLTARFHQAQERSHPSISEFQLRIDAIFKDIAQTNIGLVPLSRLAPLRSLAANTARKWRKISKALQAAEPDVLAIMKQ
jgi:hypothetical protein